MLATATQIQIKGVRGFLLFFVHLYRVRLQLVGCPGLIALRFNRKWQTLSVWDGKESMKSFRNSGAHLAVMKATRRIGIAKVVTWETMEIPTWQEATRRLASPKGA